MRNGFSLVELSIVLVILGLLVGGILAGQSLIRAAELRSVGTEISRYSTAIMAFRDKYFSLPGDMTNATAFWGDDNTNCADPAIANGTPGTCNGDGSGIVLDGSERFRFWQHLALAGLIEGTYTGVFSNPPVIGTNVPRSRIGNLGWDHLYYSPADYGWADGSATPRNHFRIGAQESTWSDLYDVLQFTAPAAWNIDTKIDDGKPGTGHQIARTYNGCPTATTTDAAYALNASGKVCGIMYYY